MAQTRDSLTATSFGQEYFLQTRREIDTEKRERDTLLNFAVLIQGGAALVVAQSDKAWLFLQSSAGLGLLIPGLVAINALMWVRHMKLKQIADRWLVLFKMLENTHATGLALGETLEGRVCQALCTRRYVMKDVVLSFALASPFYGLLILNSLERETTWAKLLLCSVIGVHSAISVWTLGRCVLQPRDRQFIDSKLNPATSEPRTRRDARS